MIPILYSANEASYKKSSTKSIIGIGDSLLAGYRSGPSITWLNKMPSKYNVSITNLAVSGTPVARTSESSPTPMVDRLSSLFKADYIVILGGANDRRFNTPLGTVDSSDPEEFCGAINTIINYIRSNNLTSNLYFLTTYRRYDELNQIGLGEIDYVNAMINVCNKRGVRVYNNYQNSGINLTSSAEAEWSAWQDDGLSRGEVADHHLSSAAYDMLLPIYANLFGLSNDAAFTSNGLGRLSDAISCTVIEEANGVYELNMTYPLDGIHAKDLEVNRIIYAKPSYDKKPQPFRIREINRSWGNRIQIVARHFCYELSYYACEEFGDSNSFPYNKDPILYSPSSVLIGVMDDTISYNVKKNTTIDRYVLTLLYPVDGKYSSQIVVNGRIFVQPDINKPTQTFYISSVSSSSSQMTVTADAPTNIHFSDGANVMDVVEALGRITHYVIDPDFPFTFEVVPKSLESSWRYTEHEWWSEYPRSVRELIMDGDGMLIDTYGGEWEWDHYKCYFHEQRGIESGVIYTYGKNISDISAVTNIDEFYTHVISYWKGSVSSSTNTEKVDNDVTEYYCHRGNVIKATSSEYDPIFPYKRTLIVDASSEFEEDPTTAQLDDYTNWYIKQNDVGIPRATIKVDVVDLASTEEYKNYAKFETVHLCDYVTVTFPMFGVDVKEQVSKVEFNVLTEKNNSITIGEPKITLADAIASNKYNIRKSKYDNQKWADKVAERATRASNGWYGGNIKKKYNTTDHKQQEMLIMDSDNEDNASHVLKADKDGISGSKEGSKGTYDAIIALHNPLGNVGVNATAVNFGTVKSQTQTKQSTWNLETGDSTMFMNKTAVGANTTDADLAGNFVEVVNGLMKIVGKLGVGASITEQELSFLELFVKGFAGVAGSLGIAGNLGDISQSEMNEYRLYVKGKAKVTDNIILDDINVKDKLNSIPDDLSGRIVGIDRSLSMVWDNIDWIWGTIQG